MTHKESSQAATSGLSKLLQNDDDDDGCLAKPRNLLKCFLVLIFTLKGYIPSNLYTADLRLLFILTALYTSLIANFRQAGVQEAQEDVFSERLFRINSIWTNHSISGGVSDQILWNCRSDSVTDSYHKSLYLGLLILHCVVIVAYFTASMVINFLVAKAVSSLNIRKDNGMVCYLEVVANEVKKAQRLRKRLNELKHEWVKKRTKRS